MPINPQKFLCIAFLLAGGSSTGPTPATMPEEPGVIVRGKDAGLGC